MMNTIPLMVIIHRSEATPDIISKNHDGIIILYYSRSLMDT